jgi:hypothetical protein
MAPSHALAGLTGRRPKAKWNGREDFSLGGSFRNLDDLNAQLQHWLDAVPNPRVHATTQRVVNEAFAEEKSTLKPLGRVENERAATAYRISMTQR